MSKRLKVLLSAYACEPFKGSEPEVGWQWALQMARFHDVTVLTRTNNRKAIEAGLKSLEGRQPLPQFVYHDEGPFLLWVKKHFKTIRLYYVLWQVSAWNVIARLHEQTPFDLMHHVSFAGFRYRTAIWNHDTPTVWGPVGGIESLPWRLFPWSHPSALFSELVRNLNNLVQATPFHVLPKRAELTTVTLVSTLEMKEAFHHLGLEADVMPTIGLHAKQMTVAPRQLAKGPLKILFVGNIITLKGIDLAIRAVAESKTDATYTIVGSGNFMAMAKKLAKDLGIESRVEFRGRLPLQETLKVYSGFGLFLFPSLHDTGGYAIIEAMSNHLPVICLDCGGPRLAVKEGAGIRVPLGTRSEVVAGLAEAIRRYDGDRQLLLEHGRAAREVVLREYDWEQKGHELDAVYKKAVEQWASPDKGAELRRKNLLHRMFPIRGLALSALILLIIGTAGFLSVERLKQDAQIIVEDTIPAVSDAGAANSSLAQSFNRTLLLVMAQTPGEQAAYRKELDRFSKQTTRSLSVYERAKFTGEELTMYNRVLDRRDHYQAVRRNVIDLIDQHKQPEALQACKTLMVPAYLEYKTAAEKLLKFNADEGRARGQNILNICLITQIAVAVVGILLFAAGFLIGLFK